MTTDDMKKLAEAEAALGQVIDQRDSYHEWADRLAYAIGGSEIGEHSSINNPWQNAIEMAEDLRTRAEAAEAALSAAREEVERLRNAPRIEFHQQDWLEGFAAFVENATTPPPESRAFCLLNLGAFLATVEHGHVEKAELPYFVAESMMHEVVHALEQWAGVEFSEERVEALLVKYRAATLTKEPTDV